MTPEKFFECWMSGGPAAREAMRNDVAALLQAERERLADIVRGWHIKKGGYEALAYELTAVPFPKQES